MFRHELAVALLSLFAGAAAADESHPLTDQQRDELKARHERIVAQMTVRIARDPADLDGYSRRGDAYFCLGEFARAAADYDKMVDLEPQLAAAHWRRGIACFYARRFEEAARQFEAYHSLDDVDRENGIWRFFSQVKAHGLKTARERLLQYKKDDRQPFPAVYQLFAEQTTPDAILRSIASADIDAVEREKRLFYAHLYIGLEAAIVRNDAAAAIKHLRKAVANTWAPRAGFGPNYMWHVGRVHYEQLQQDPAAQAGGKPADARP